MPSGLDQATLEQQLAAAERHVSEGLDRICHQKEMIAELERDKHLEAALEQAHSVLKTLTETQALQVQERDRLKAELSAIGP
jgi:hypothetical protein